ncbi:MAG TPA: hypothetical protein DDY20_01900 [Desulfobulbaceae bacterium]|nr:hypothetical protein [Desulfobulbaceae bacterium]
MSLPIDPRRGSGPRVSVIVPVYNVEAYLRECLDSIARQTLDDLEVICVNDASPDRSLAILTEYAGTDRRFVVLNHMENKGLPGARNSGLDIAKGDFIYFIDSDDLLASADALETLYARSITDDADEVIGGIVKWNQDTGEKYLDWHKNYLEKEVCGLSLLDLPQLCANVIACNKLIRADLINENKIRFNESILKNEDNPFSVQIHILSRRISIVTKTTYIYRQTNSSIMATAKKTDALYRWMYCHDVFKFIEENHGRHIFRKFYYPMYSGNLVESAGTLSRFEPSEDEKSSLLLQWKKTVDILPDDLPDIPSRQRKIFAFIQDGEMDKAWIAATEYSEQVSRVHTELIVQLERLKKANLALLSNVEAVQNSISWRVTSPLRAFSRFIKGT